MTKTHFKDTIGKAVLCAVLLFLGEGLLGWGLFWPVLLALASKTSRAYYLAFGLGLLWSVMTASPLGLASLLLVVWLFVFGRIRGWLGDNVWLTALTAAAFGLATDRVLGLSWSLLEGGAIGGVTWLFWRLDYFSDEVHLRR